MMKRDPIWRSWMMSLARMMMMMRTVSKNWSATRMALLIPL